MPEEVQMSQKRHQKSLYRKYLIDIIALGFIIATLIACIVLGVSGYGE